MSQGPILIFDKSALQSLNPDEAVWLDNFFLCNITPLFFIETLADLEKEVRAGRTPEQVVGNLAFKTPDMQSHPNVYHGRLLAAELAGMETIVMDGRLLKSGGRMVSLDRKKGFMFHRTQEEQALFRWQRHEFLDLDRQLAKVWRQGLSKVDYEEIYQSFQQWYTKGKPKDLYEVKALAERNIDETDQERSLLFGMSLLRVQEAGQNEVMKRWHDAGKPAIGEFAPYFRYVFSIDLFFYLAIAADLISRERPVGKADNKIDIAYLYYLPFCMVFTSSDNLHERVVPLFLRDDQSFVKGQELKADLHKLDEHYAAFPEEVKIRGLHHFAGRPPSETSFLVTRLWDKHLPAWRKQEVEKQDLSPEAQKALVDLMNRIDKESQSSDPRERLTTEEIDYIQIKREVLRKKGKWSRFPPDVK